MEEEDKEKELLKELDDTLEGIKEIFKKKKENLQKKQKNDEIPKADGEVDSERGKRDREEFNGGRILLQVQEKSLDTGLDHWVMRLGLSKKALVALPLSCEQHEKYRFEIGEAIDMILGLLTHDAGYESHPRNAVSVVVDLMAIAGDDRRLTLAMQMLGQPKKFKSSARLIAAMVLGQVYSRPRVNLHKLASVLPEAMLNTYCVALEDLEKTMASIKKKKKDKGAPIHDLGLPTAGGRSEDVDIGIGDDSDDDEDPGELPSVQPGALPDMTQGEEEESDAANGEGEVADEEGNVIEHLDEGGALVHKWYPTVVDGCLGVLDWHHRDLVDNPLFQKAQQLVVKSVPSIKHDGVLADKFVWRVKDGILGPIESLHGELQTVLEFEIARSHPVSSSIFTCARVEAFGDQPVRLLGTFSSFQLRMGRRLDSQLAMAARSEHGIPGRGAELALCLVMPLGASQEEWAPTLTWRAALKGSSSWHAIKELTENPTHPVWACDAFYDNEGSPAMSNKEEVMTYMTKRVADALQELATWEM